MAERISIEGINKAELLAALYNASAPTGMGFMWAGRAPAKMTAADTQAVIDGRGDDSDEMFSKHRGPCLSFDYLHGRPLKVDLRGNDFDPWGFDRDNGGPGTAARIIERLRALAPVS